MDERRVAIAVSKLKINTGCNIYKKPHQESKKRTKYFSKILCHFRIHAKHYTFSLIVDKVSQYKKRQKLFGY